jgi:hypothetical protein
MDKKQLSPLQTVVQEMAIHSSMTEPQLEKALVGVLEHLNRRAVAAMEKDIDSLESVRFAREYQAIAEVIEFLGVQLIAYEEIEIDDGDRIKN